ncbi:hypothetical protein OCJ37_14895 [Xanthomonas sp. AM6]|uniref:hypothetical protein n=1 Tax=Xanthomonas sp. AM6 TaxID=2982531 RepID=UPI0021D8CB37|nr:hypothetical protein [Xanthomonas sp. AM6]UYB51273.1 hypothetical protein OCJ37_14895 [Xanthomonas sp. AM6]
MNTHAQTQAALAHLARMLPEWCAHLRHPAEFWPQFSVLAQEVLDEADPRDRAQARRALAKMLASEAIDARMLAR